MRADKIKYVVLSVFMGFVLSACSVFSPVPGETTNTYVLSRIPKVSVAQSSRAMTLLVNYPQMSAVYNTTDIAYSTYPFQLAYFAKSQWADTPPQMLQPLMVQTLQNTHHFRNVISPMSGGQYNYVLNTQLLHLEQVFFNHSSRVRIVLKAQLVSVATNQIIASKEFSVEEPASPTPYGGVVAANRGVSRILAQLAAFTCKNS